MNNSAHPPFFLKHNLSFMRRPVQLILDSAALSASFLLAYLLRFDFQIPENFLETALDQLPFVVLLQFMSLFLVGSYSLIWRYISLEDAKFFIRAALSSAIILILIRLLLPTSFERWKVPLSITLMTSVFGFVTVFGLRMLRRWIYELVERRKTGGLPKRHKTRKPVLFVGAGLTGAMAVKEIWRHEDAGFDVKGFVDDDRQKRGGSVNGIKVLGTTEDLPRLVEELQIKQVIIAFDRSSGKEVRRILDICRQISVKAQILPTLHEIVGGQVRLERIRDVQIQDLLGREPTELNDKEIGAFLTGKIVMVTGAGGSIGSELVRQIAAFEPENLLLVERAEFNLFEIDRELRLTFPNLNKIALIADCDEALRMREIFAEFRPSVVFHAAAHKHVPLMEQNPCEAVKNNIFVTELVAELAGEFSAEAVVLISTDKAVNPTSVMGASKRLAELVAQSANQRFQTNYMAVRFGNVLGSTGSVIPIFREQIRTGKAVTITHPEMTRYFMTIPEAAQLVLQAAAIGHGGEIFILDMGEPVRILQLAEDLIRLSGLQPYEDIDIEFTGIRQGEKLFEELETEGENLLKTRHPKIYIGKIAEHAPHKVKEMLSRFAEAVEESDSDKVRRLFNEFLPEARITVESDAKSGLVSETVATNKRLSALMLDNDNASTNAFAS